MLLCSTVTQDVRVFHMSSQEELFTKRWLAAVKKNGDEAEVSYPCCICGSWFDVKNVRDVSDLGVSDIAKKYFNTTLKERYLCFDRQCKSTFEGTAFHQQRRK